MLLLNGQDYYDCIKSYGVDKSIVYLRNKKIKRFKRFNATQLKARNYDNILQNYSRSLFECPC